MPMKTTVEQADRYETSIDPWTLEHMEVDRTGGKVQRQAETSLTGPAMENRRQQIQFGNMHGTETMTVTTAVPQSTNSTTDTFGSTVMMDTGKPTVTWNIPATQKQADAVNTDDQMDLDGGEVHAPPGLGVKESIAKIESKIKKIEARTDRDKAADGSRTLPAHEVPVPELELTDSPQTPKDVIT